MELLQETNREPIPYSELIPNILTTLWLYGKFCPMPVKDIALVAHWKEVCHS